LSIREIATDDSKGIEIALRFEGTNEVHLHSASRRALWIELSSTDLDYIWILTTTTYLKEEIEIFEIDMETQTSRRIE